MSELLLNGISHRQRVEGLSVHIKPSFFSYVITLLGKVSVSSLYPIDNFIIAICFYYNSFV